MKPMLAGVVEFVIGVDTHRDSHTAAIVHAATGGVIEQLTVPTDAFGYRRLKAFADQHAGGARVWAIEGTGSYGAGLTSSLLEHGEWSSRSTAQPDRPVATAPSLTTLTRSARPAKRSAESTSPPRERAGTVKRCES